MKGSSSPDEQSRMPANPASSVIAVTLAMQLGLIVKELKETLRDRRTITTLLAMPVLVYPLLGMGFRFLALKQSSIEQPRYQIVVQTKDEQIWLQSALRLSEPPTSADPQRSDQKADETGSAAEKEPNPAEAAVGVLFEFFITDQATPEAIRQAIQDQNADLGVIVSLAKGGDPGDLARREVQLVEAEGSVTSRRAADFVERQLMRFHLEATRQMIRQIDPRLSLPMQLNRSVVQVEGQASVLLGFLPLVLLLMTVTGGVYPAIDLTAGERERDTLETLMALPIPAFRLIMAKFAAVVGVTILTGLMNLVAMSITVYVLQLEQTLFGDAGITGTLILQLMVVLVTFAVFYSSMLLVLTSSARSFKEAQAFLIPLLLISISPGLVILLPGWNLNLLTATIPMVNMLLMAKGVFEGTAAALPAVVAVLTTLGYAVVSLSVAARFFGTDAVATGSASSWSDLVRRPDAIRPQPTVSTAVTTLALLVPGHFVASGLLGRDNGFSMMQRMLVSGCLTVGLFLLFPLTVAIWNRLNLKSSFRVLRFSGLSALAAVLIGSSTWPFIFELITRLQELGMVGIDASKLEQAESLLQSLTTVPVPILVVALGILPAVCEEAFFRGFLFSGLRNHLSAGRTVWVTAIAFGLFHVILAGGAAPERLVPSTLMGLLLGWVSVRTGSLIPGILLHAVHNSLLLTIASFQEELAGFAVGLQSQQHLPTSWLAVAGAVLVAGLGLLQSSGRQRPDGSLSAS